MADKKISELDAITGANTAADDFFIVVDSSGSATKKISRAELNNAIERDVLSTVDIDGGTIDGTTIGGTTAAAGTFTDLTATGTVSLSGALSDVVDDSSPQLGGDLDLNSNNITGTGNIDVTGTVTADDNITLEGASTPRITLTDTTNTAQAFLEAGNTVARVGSLSDHNFEIRANNDLAIQVSNNGDITFFGDDETTQGLRWDASTQRLGLGTTSPAGPLEVSNSGGDANVFITTGTTNSSTTILFGDSASDDRGRVMYDHNNDSMRLHTAGSEQMRIDSSGRVGIGKTPSNKPLEIYSGSNPAIRIQNSTTGTTNSDGFLLEQNGSNTLLVNYESGYQAFYTGGSERMRIDSSGNVGIGTTSPNKVLHLETSGETVQRMVASTTNLAGFYFGDSDNGSIGQLIYDNSSDAMRFNTNGSEQMRITSGGSVGIGKTAPASALHISNSTYPQLEIDDATSRNFAMGVTSSTFRIRDVTGTADRLTIDTSGNVGIGTSSPAGLLSLEANNPNIRFDDSDTSNNGEITLDNASLRIEVDDDNAVANSVIKFRVDGSEQMRIDSSGNVGIGTTSPTTTSGFQNGKFIEVRNSGTASDATDNASIQIKSDSRHSLLSLMSSASYSGYINFGDGNDNDAGQIRYNHSNNAMSFNTNGSEAFRVDSSGNLLVGTTSLVVANSASNNGFVFNTNGELEIGSTSRCLTANRQGSDGDAIRFQKDGTTVGSISVTASGTTYNTTSDIRLKTDIAPIAEATDKLMAMNAVSHRWKADPDADAVIGFIAQEMAEIVPEAVSKGDSEDDMWSMDYGRITPVLVAALQDAHKKIEDLESRLAALEAN